MSISLLASQLPIPTGPVGTYPIPTVASPNKNSPEAEGWISSRQSTELSLALNQLATRSDIGSVFAAGFGIIYGLICTVSSGLSLAVSAGQANIYGVAFIPASTIALPNNTALVYVWLKSDYVSGSGTSSLVYTTTTTPPSTSGSAGQCVLLSVCTTSGGAITNIDTSGVVYLSKGGLPIRRTADVGTPSDAPSSGTIFLTRCLGGLYLWDGLQYHRLPDTGTLTVTGSSSPTSDQTLVRTILVTGGGGYILTVAKEYREWIVRNTSSSTIGIYDGTSTVTVAAGKTALVGCDATSVYRISADA